MHIVLAMIEPPLPFASAAGRWYYVLLRGLVKRGHRVTAFACCGKPAEIEAARVLFPPPLYDLRLFPMGVHRGWRARLHTLRRPFSYMYDEDLRKEFQVVLKQGCDVIHLEQLWSAWLGIGHEAKVLVSLHYLLEIDFAEVRPSTLSDWRYRMLEAYAERRLLGRFRHFRACTDRIANVVTRRNPEADVSVVPFGIDTSLYAYRPDHLRPREPMVTMIGNMAWTPSRTAAERLLTRLWPGIKARVPEAKLRIVGWEAKRTLARLRHDAMPDVEVLENVPRIQPYFEDASVLLYAPGQGSGMKIKIQEAMAYGVPVVTTSEGVEGLPASDGVHAGICDDDAGLIDRTVALLSDSWRQDRQRLAARQLIETFCSPVTTLDAIEAIYAKIIVTNLSGLHSQEDQENTFIRR